MKEFKSYLSGFLHSIVTGLIMIAWYLFLSATFGWWFYAAFFNAKLLILIIIAVVSSFLSIFNLNKFVAVDVSFGRFMIASSILPALVTVRYLFNEYFTGESIVSVLGMALPLLLIYISITYMLLRAFNLSKVRSL